MPLKVRCNGCRKVLNIPDRARGKSVKCPNCETVLRIPAAGATTKSRGARKRRSPAPAVERDDFLGDVDLRRAADSRVRVCVKCGTEVKEVEEEEEEVVDCPECGHNVDTGVMSDYIRKKRERKGPDPEEFWGVAWSGSLKFIRKNLSLVCYMAAYWSFFATIIGWAFFALITGLSDVPEIIIGLTIVCGVLISLFGLAFAGWFWCCACHLIRHTMGPSRKKVLENFNFDFFECIALGIKAQAWPGVLFLPFSIPLLWILAVQLLVTFFLWPLLLPALPVLAVIGDFVASNATLVLVINIVVLSLASIVFPVAMIHMTMPYTYKAWTPYHMGLYVGKNILAVLYWWVIALVAVLPIALPVLILSLTWEGGWSQLFIDLRDIIVDLEDWFLRLFDVEVPEESIQDRKWYWRVYAILMSIFPIAIIVTTVCFVWAFSAAFLMRANGYFGLYFRDKLGIVKEQPANVPCGFWPRYLACLADWLLLGLAGAVAGSILFGAVFAVEYLDLGYLLYIIYLVGGLLLVTFPWFYYAKPESNPAWRGSIGKRALGIVVVMDNEKFETLEFGLASGRYWLKILLGPVTLFGGWLMAAFSDKKRALHDSILKTLVVWEGDDERS